MATATLGTINLTEIDDADANTDWTEFDVADPDILKEGTNAMSGILRADLDNGYVSKGSPISCSGEHLRFGKLPSRQGLRQDAVDQPQRHVRVPLQVRRWHGERLWRPGDVECGPEHHVVRRGRG